MSINASPEVIEQLKNEMTKVISDIEEIKNDVNSGLGNSPQNLDKFWRAIYYEINR